MILSHTPEPWEWRNLESPGAGQADWLLWRAAGSRLLILDVYKGHLRVRGENVLMVPFSPDHPDARLIVAAPEMLTALKAVMEFFHDAWGDDDLYQCAKQFTLRIAPLCEAAIAKTEGKP